MPQEPSDRPVSPKRAKFAQEYVRDMNAKQAAIRAGYSPKTAHQIGYENLNIPEVAGRIGVLAKTAAEQAGIESVQVLKQVARVAFFDPRKLLDVDGKPIPLEHLPDDVAMAIQSVDIVPVKFQKETGIPVAWAYRFKMADKNSAAEKLMKHLGLFEKDNQQQVDAVSDFLSAIHNAGSRIPLKPPEE